MCELTAACEEAHEEYNLAMSVRNWPHPSLGTYKPRNSANLAAVLNAMQSGSWLEAGPAS